MRRWLASWAAACGGEPPAQPVDFPHDRHAEVGMTCAECHPGATDGVAAGLPDAEDCLRCHAFDLVAPARAAPIAKLRALAARGEPLRWARLYALAPHATFSHRAHARVVQCRHCHGETGTSRVARDELGLSGEALMDWCMDCHADKGASNQCLTCHR